MNRRPTSLDTAGCAGYRPLVPDPTGHVMARRLEHISGAIDEPIPDPALLQIFLGFASISALAFGGVLPWARHVLVDRRRWLTPEEFVDMLALCQLLPGANIINMSVAIGARFRGGIGSLVAVLGMMALPITIVLALIGIYSHFAGSPRLEGALAAMAAAAAGLVIAMAAKMAEPVFRARFRTAAPFMALTFVAVAILQLPLWPVILVLAPLSIAVGWRRR